MSKPDPNDNLLDELAADAPFERMRSRFEGLIAERPREARPSPARLAWAAAAIVALAGLLAVWLQPRGPSVSGAGAQAVLELLEAPSTFERLRGINVAADLPRPSPALLAALFDRLQRDRSVNVRLAALDALLDRNLPPAEQDRLTGLLMGQQTAIVQAHLGHRLRRERWLSRDELQRILEHPGIRGEARDALIALEES